MCTLYLMNHTPEFISHKTKVPRMDTLVPLPNIPQRPQMLGPVLCFFSITSDNKYVVLPTPTNFQRPTNCPLIQIWHHADLAHSLQLLGSVKQTRSPSSWLLCMVTPVTFLKSYRGTTLSQIIRINAIIVSMGLRKTTKYTSITSEISRISESLR
jgi:hypothetical protein